MGALLGLGVLLAGCAGGTPGAGPTPGPSAARTAAPTVECGLSTFEDGHQVIRYCGDGVARVVVGEGFVDIDGAACQQRGAFVTANFGTNYSRDGAASGDYVGLLLGELPVGGADHAEANLSGIEVTVDGGRVQVEDATASVAVSGGGLEGTVTGGVPGDGPIEIAFNCVLD